MTLLFSSLHHLRPHLLCLARSIHQPQPHLRFPIPPARRRFEPAPSAPVLPTPTPPAHHRPTNRQIPFSHVYVLDPVTKERSPTKQPLKSLLAPHILVELVTARPEPIVRVTTRAAVEARNRALRRAARECDEKEVRLAWGVARADVVHKMRKATKDLEKGCRVVVVVSFKGRQASRRELVAFADEIAGMLEETGKECRGRAFSGYSMTLSFQKVEQDP